MAQEEGKLTWDLGWGLSYLGLPVQVLLSKLQESKQPSLWRLTGGYVIQTISIKLSLERKETRFHFSSALWGPTHWVSKPHSRPLPHRPQHQLMPASRESHQPQTVWDLNPSCPLTGLTGRPWLPLSFPEQTYCRNLKNTEKLEEKKLKLCMTLNGRYS